MFSVMSMPYRAVIRKYTNSHSPGAANVHHICAWENIALFPSTCALAGEFEVYRDSYRQILGFGNIHGIFNFVPSALYLRDQSKILGQVRWKALLIGTGFHFQNFLLHVYIYFGIISEKIPRITHAIF